MNEAFAVPRITDITDCMGVSAGSEEADLVNVAFIYSAQCHSGQKRKSGEPYLNHPLEVAYILAEWGLDPATIATGLLHDTVEDTHATLEEIEEQFGVEIRHLVDGVTKISQIEFSSAEQKAADNFRKMVVAMAQDIRVLVVKLADRTHNMRTLDHMPSKKQKRIAQETMDIYAPLADRLGMNGVKTELQDLSFRYLFPEEYAELLGQMEAVHPERQRYVDGTLDAIRIRLQEADLAFTKIYGRAKHLYSIWMKMQKKGISLEQVYDAVAFRVIVSDIAACYGVLGHLHALWRPVPGRFKDFIALPKKNGYRSLHTTVAGPSGSLIEIQIRTEEMDAVADSGLAAHWHYKEGGQQPSKDLAYEWLNRLREWQQEVDDPSEFLETVRSELFHEEIFVFTPAGDVIQLPRGASPVDFAFAVHTEVGLHCVGAKVNGRMVPLRKPLESGDRVEVMTDRRRLPNREWLDFVVTSRARTRIRTAIRRREQEEAAEIGRNLLERALKANGSSINAISQSGALDDYIERWRGGHTLDDLLAQVGFNKLSTETLVERLLPEQQTVPPRSVASPQTSSLAARLFGRRKPKGNKSGVEVGGLDNVLISFANCCSPLPGDQIVGYVTRGQGVRVHRLACETLTEFSPERMVEVRWSTETDVTHQVSVRLVSDDRPGILANVSICFQDLSINISEANCRVLGDGTAIHTFRFGIESLEKLETIVQRLKSLKGISRVERA